ncbi:MAG: hypothetical protein AAGB31_01610 [Bdellovibrio sp.]
MKKAVLLGTIVTMLSPSVFAFAFTSNGSCSGCKVEAAQESPLAKEALVLLVNGGSISKELQQKMVSVQASYGVEMSDEDLLLIIASEAE